MMVLKTMRSIPLALLISFATYAATADLERSFTQTVRPFLTTYCYSCHATATPAAQFDLRPYTNLASVVQDFGHWNLVLDKLTANQMPPAPVKQPPADTRREIID